MFDSRQAVFDILPLFGIPEPIVEAIKPLYMNAEATVITPDGETEFFKISTGVLQGGTLAPFDSIIFLDYVLRLSLDPLNNRSLKIQSRQSRTHPARHLTCRLRRRLSIGHRTSGRCRGLAPIARIGRCLDWVTLQQEQEGVHQHW